MELYFLIILPIFTSLLLYLLPGKVTTWLGSFLYLAVFGVTVHLFYRVRFGGEIVTTGGSPDFLGISLYCDLTASVFLMLVGFLFLCVFLYTNLPVRVNKLYSFLFTVLEGLIMLIFLSRDLFNIYVAIEVSAICCGVLIMFKRESRSIYDGLIYLLTNITGMLFFLLGIGLVYRQCGVLDFDGLAAAAAYRTPQELLLAYVFLMTGVCMKCALFPMHFWLPAAHGTPGAPTAVSAILSGLYIKSGVRYGCLFLLGRGRHRAGGYRHGGLSVRYQADSGLPHHLPGGPDHCGAFHLQSGIPLRRHAAYHQPCIIQISAFPGCRASHHRLRHPERI